MKKKLLAIALCLALATGVMFAAWDAVDSSTQLTTISDTYQYFDDVVTTTPAESCHMQVDVNYAGTTDLMQVSVFTTLDTSTENWDDVPAITFTMGDAARTNDPEGISFVVSGFYKFRVGVQSTGVTDDHTSADMKYRCDGIDAS